MLTTNNSLAINLSIIFSVSTSLIIPSSFSSIKYPNASELITPRSILCRILKALVLFFDFSIVDFDFREIFSSSHESAVLISFGVYPFSPIFSYRYPLNEFLFHFTKYKNNYVDYFFLHFKNLILRI